MNQAQKEDQTKLNRFAVELSNTSMVNMARMKAKRKEPIYLNGNHYLITDTSIKTDRLYLELQYIGI